MIVSSGMKLGGYDIEAELGRGGMGVVYRARSPRGYAVALKTVPVESRSGESGRLRFEREARAAISVQHENVVALLDAGAERGTSYLVFELVAGGSVEERVLRTGPVPWQQAARMGAAIARGLAAIHDANLVHRDLKPANVLLDAGGVPKIADLGLARGGAGSAIGDSLTRTGELVGTPAFLAPEQADSAKTADARADLYALGGTLYFMLVGEPPFGGTPMAMVKAHMMTPPPHPRVRKPDVPLALDALVVRLLSKDPAARGASAGRVAAELEAIAAGTLKRVPRKLVRRVAALAGVAALAAAGGGVWLLGAPPPAATPRARPPPPPPPPPPRPRAAPTEIDTGQEAVLAMAFAAKAPNLLATSGQDHRVKVWDVTTGRLVKTCAGPKKPVRTVALSPSGDWVLAGDDDSVVWSWNRDLDEGSAIARHPNREDKLSRAPAVAFAEHKGALVALSAGVDHFINLNVLHREEPTLRHVQEWDYGVTAVAAVGTEVFYGTDPGIVARWVVAIHEREAAIQRYTTQHDKAVTAVAVTRDASLGVSGSADGTVKLWELGSNFEVERSPRIVGLGSVKALSLIGEPEQLFVAGEHDLFVFDVRSGPARWHRFRDRKIDAAAISPDGKMIAVGEGALVHLVAR